MPLCATKVSDLNNDFFIVKEKTVHGFTNMLIYQNVFDEIEAELEKFRCKTYGIKHKELKKVPISGSMKYFGKDKE